jgi:hypothetical protein
MTYPVIIGGNGHSGTRIFAEVLAQAGVRMGIARITRSSAFDLNIRKLLHRWVGPYLHRQLSDADLAKMRRELSTRLRIYFPFRSGPWGFKNPRSMLILPVYAEMFPSMKFIHVIRDGRDVTLGNELAGNEDYISAFTKSAEGALSPEERMITFWGRSNSAAQTFGEQHLGERYLRVRFEDLCDRPAEHVARIVSFAGLPATGLDAIIRLVKKPTSIGRWRSFEPAVVRRVENAGRPWLDHFGYQS